MSSTPDHLTSILARLDKLETQVAQFEQHRQEWIEFGQAQERYADELRTNLEDWKSAKTLNTVS